eukprot:s826_g18.t1
MSSSSSTRGPGGGEHGLDAEVPAKVKKWLEESKDFGEFKNRRVFTFLHLFAGPRDVLAEELKKECDKEGIALAVESFDKLLNPAHDLAAEQPFADILKKAKEDEYDSGHAGFPCGSFSRARYNSGSGPPPVRSLTQIYGLESNTKSQQREADRGTVFAVRSALVISEIVQSQRRRAVPPAGTLENPPGSETKEEGPAWALPELISFEKDLGAITAIFNTCAYQDKLKERWFKPGRFTGCLTDLHTLSKKCSCPSWVKHQSLIGKALTSRAAEYPQLLAQAYAVLVVKTFKTTLQMEWWRHVLKVKKAEVSDAQMRWLASKNKRQIPPTVTPDLSASRRAWLADNVDEDAGPSEGPSKKQRREGENEHFIGGMRNPAKAVARLHKVAETGRDVRRLWSRFLKDHPKALQAAMDYGSEDCALDEDVLRDWTDTIEHFLKVREFPDVVLKPTNRFVSPLNAKLWEAWRRQSGDPERDLVDWIRMGTPLGMAEDIPYCGIFPKVEDEEPENLDMPDMEAQLGAENYKSFTDEPIHAQAEVQRYLEKGFCIEMSEDELKQQFPNGTLSRLALIVKTKEDGSVKRRVIIDLLRSGGNSRCRISERIILPRIQDVIQSLKYLCEARFGLFLRAQREEWEDQDQCGEIELASADLADAYCHLAVAESELANCAAPSVTPGKYLVFTAMLFGFRGAPLVMGRFASMLARLVQALIPPDEMQSQLYMDDPLWILQGPRWRRMENLSLILYMCGALGVRLQFRKGFRGSDAIWIGTKIELKLAEEVVVLSIPLKMMNEVRSILESWSRKGMVPLRDVRSVAGKLSWICGIIVRARWCVNILYAVISQTMADAKLEVTRAQKRDDTRPKPNMVAVSRVELPRQWFIAMFNKPDKFALRREPLFEVQATVALISDASPRGVGVILADIDRKEKKLIPLEALEIPVTQAIATWMGIPWDQAAGQGPLEAWAILMGLRKWKHRLRGLTILLRSDSVVALATARRASAPSPVLNWVGAEMALKAEELQLGRFVCQHIPGSWNIETDWLSRPHQRGAMPARLQGVPLRQFPKDKVMVSALGPPGADAALRWGQSSSVISTAFDEL